MSCEWWCFQCVCVCVCVCVFLIQQMLLVTFVCACKIEKTSFLNLCSQMYLSHPAHTHTHTHTHTQHIRRQIRAVDGRSHDRHATHALWWWLCGCCWRAGHAAGHGQRRCCRSCDEPPSSFSSPSAISSGTVDAAVASFDGSLRVSVCFRQYCVCGCGCCVALTVAARRQRPPRPALAAAAPALSSSPTVHAHAATPTHACAAAVHAVSQPGCGCLYHCCCRVGFCCSCGRHCRVGVRQA